MALTLAQAIAAFKGPRTFKAKNGSTQRTAAWDAYLAKHGLSDDASKASKPVTGTFGQQPKPAAPKPSTPSTQKPAAPGTPPVDGSLTAHLTDPDYQKERAALDLELANAKNAYEQAMGGSSGKGSIWQDYDYAVNSLTRNNRKGIGQTNAGISGSNLAGSGVAKKQLSDIAAEFFSDKGKLDTDRTRAESAATQAWQDSQLYHSSSDLAGMRGAADRWRERNLGYGSDTSTATKKTVGKAPKGMAYTKDPKTGLRSLKPYTPPKKTVGKAPPGMKYVKNPLTKKYTLKRV